MMQDGEVIAFLMVRLGLVFPPIPEEKRTMSSFVAHMTAAIGHDWQENTPAVPAISRLCFELVAMDQEVRAAREEAVRLSQQLEEERAFVRELEGLATDLLTTQRRAMAAMDRTALAKANRLAEARAKVK